MPQNYGPVIKITFLVSFFSYWPEFQYKKVWLPLTFQEAGHRYSSDTEAIRYASQYHKGRNYHFRNGPSGMLKLRWLTDEYPTSGMDRAARKTDGEEELFAIIIFQPHPSRRKWGVSWGQTKSWQENQPTCCYC